jgi:L-seryl-tRNA(Ser) seleniumtransferase
MPDPLPSAAALRALPSVDEVLRDAKVAALARGRSREALARAVRAAIGAERARILGGGAPRAGADPRPDAPARDAEGVLLDPALLVAVERALAREARPALRRAVNATGVVLHTGLGRAVLAPAARAAIDDVARGYSLLEVDLESGERGEREAGCAALLRELTGAPAATVVNNNAAACLLALAALARGREVVVARGQLVEIGGSFRIPEVMAESGARLREVGATNKVHLADYERAIGSETAAILKVHTSNFKVVGFTEDVPLERLARLARERGILLIEDLGSGNLLDPARWAAGGFADIEPPVAASVAAGADLVTFSGDKLLGGPQCGIAVGDAEAVARLRRHPLFRAVRPDKLTLAALEATLRLYRDGDPARDVPALALLLGPAEPIRVRAEALARALAPLAPRLEARAVPSEAQPGSGALPATTVPSFAVALRAPDLGAAALAARLRLGEPPVFARIRRDEVLLDCRTVLAGEEPEVEAAVRAAMSAPNCST